MQQLNIKNKKTFLIALIIIIIDIISKQVISNLMLENQSIKLINNLLYITYVKNTGVAFSLLEGKIPIIVIITIIITIFLIKYTQEKNLNKLEKISYGLVIGGAIGNLIDRIIYGYVIDFIDVKIFSYNYPIFNLADSFIVIGIILILIDGIKKESSDNHDINTKKTRKNR